MIDIQQSPFNTNMVYMLYMYENRPTNCVTLKSFEIAVRINCTKRPGNPLSRARYRKNCTSCSSSTFQRVELKALQISKKCNGNHVLHESKRPVTDAVTRVCAKNLNRRGKQQQAREREVALLLYSYEASHNRSKPITAYSSSSLFSPPVNSECIRPLVPGSPSGDSSPPSAGLGETGFECGSDGGSDGTHPARLVPGALSCSRRCVPCAPVDSAPCAPESSAPACPDFCEAVTADRARFGTQTRFPKSPLIKSERSGPIGSLHSRLRFAGGRVSSKATCTRSPLHAHTYCKLTTGASAKRPVIAYQRNSS